MSKDDYIDIEGIMTTMNSEEINELELIGHNAWVAQERMRLGGWLFRGDHGVTRRANSVLPLDSPGLALSSAIDFTIEFYRSRDLIPRFQVSPASLPSELDSELSSRGFSIGLQVEVWIAEISALLELQPTCDAMLVDEISDDWIDTFIQSSSHDPSTMDVRKAIMERTLQPRAFVQANVENSVASVGYGVVEGNWLGVFNIGTHPDKRKLGAATAVNHELGKWGNNLGATRIYLQVEVDNDDAKALYKKMGFIHAYKYWYRMLE